MRVFYEKLVSLLAAPSAFCMLTPLALACSGPTSGEFREQNRLIVNAYGLVAIFILAAIVAVYFVRGRTGLVLVLIAALVGFFHPVWHFGWSGSPDCGQHFAESAPYMTGIIGGILLVQLAVWTIRRRAPRKNS